MSDHSVYVTGVGVVSSLGVDYPSHVKGLYEMETQIHSAHFNHHGHHLDSFVGKVSEAIEVPEQFKDYYKNFKFAFNAFSEALIDSGVNVSEYKKIGICLGTSLGGKVVGQEVLEKTLRSEYDVSFEEFERRSIHHIVDELLGFYEIEAEYYVISTACSASNNAAILGTQLLKSGACDVVFAGGCDELTDISLAGFSSLGAINRHTSCQPYTNGSGISLGEGAGFIVLEKATTAKGKKTYAKILGGSISSDGYHITAPDKSGKGAEKIIDTVLDEADVTVEEIDYVNGHGTGTQANDTMERYLFERKFPETTTISSTKGHIGHTLGAAGMIELINCIAAIQYHRIPGTINQETGILRPHFIKNKVEKKAVFYALNLSFAFGGNNSCVLVGAPTVPEQGMRASDYQEVKIIGSSSSLANGNNQLVSPSSHPNYHLLESPYSPIKGYKFNDFTIPDSINPQHYRRIDHLSKMVVKTVLNAFRDAGMEPSTLAGDRTGIMFTTPSGPVETIEEIEQQVYESGYHNASAVKFPFTVMNASAGILSILFKIKGPVSVISTVGTCFVDGVGYAKEMLKYEDIDRVILVSANQLTELSLIMWDKLGFDNNIFTPTDFCSAFILEKGPHFESESSHMSIVDCFQRKYSNKQKSKEDIQLIFEDALTLFLDRNKLQLIDIDSYIFNANRCTCHYEYSVMMDFSHRFPNTVLSNMSFSSDGAGEELSLLLEQIEAKGSHLIVTSSTFGGFSFLLLYQE